MNDDDLLIEVLTLCEIPLPKQRRSFETYHRILRAAQQCASSLGYSKASTLEIAKRAEISHGGLFKRFPTKASIMVAMIGYLEALARRDARAQVQTSPLPESIHERVKLFIEGYWAFVQTEEFKAIDEIWDASRTDGVLLQALRPVIASDVVSGDLTLYFPEVQNGVEVQFLSQIVYSSLEYLSFNHGQGADDQIRTKLDFVIAMVCREIEHMARSSTTPV